MYYVISFYTIKDAWFNSHNVINYNEICVYSFECFPLDSERVSIASVYYLLRSSDAFVHTSESMQQNEQITAINIPSKRFVGHCFSYDRRVRTR